MSVVKNIFVDFGHFQLDIPHLTLADEGITAIVGPSGSGKTTFLKVLLGLYKCPVFSWIFKEQDLAHIPPQQRRLGIVFQDNEVFPHLTVWQNMHFAGKPRLKSKQSLEKLLKHVSQALDITHLLKQKARHLSGGERQRLALANALMSRPYFLLLDEPFSSLDKQRHASAKALIKDITKEFAIPVLMVTHDFSDVREMASSIVMLSKGRVKSISEIDV